MASTAWLFDDDYSKLWEQISCGKLNETFISSRVSDAQLLSKNMSETLEDFRTFFNPNRAKKAFNIKEVIQKAIDLSKYQLEKEEILLSLRMKEDLEVFGFKMSLFMFY